MKSKIRTTCEGLIIIPPSKIVKICKANSIEATKKLGADVLLDADHICFLTFNGDGRPCFFMSNGYEVALNTEYIIMREAWENAKARKQAEFE
jgi:hypothetical protein